MRIDPINLYNQSRLITDYVNNKEEIVNKFEYYPYDENTYKERLKDLQERNFERDQLVEVLSTINSQWGAPASTLHNIERLKMDNSVVVIGGQQAGLLMGPLYTLNKIISIIHLAKEQEQHLNIPVIPVFWIAGEDHDFDEINHIMMQQQSRMKKHKITQRVSEKVSMSSCPLDKDAAETWMKGIFKQLNETEHSKKLYQLLQNTLNQSETFVDFFARIIFSLFETEGLVLIDSGNQLVRKLESNFFSKIINEQPTISEGVYKTLQKVQQQGYPISVEVDEQDAHLFYHKNGERILLVRSEDNMWRGKQNECAFSTEELLQIAAETPELLSNNVVTRPLMQEFLFPSLAFLGGPSEVGYWSILKPAFHAMDMKMPPVLPRLSFTLVDQKTEKKVNKYSLEVESIVNYGVDLEKGNWLAAQTSPPLEQLTDQLKFSIERAHKPLRDLATSISPDLSDVAEKNLFFLFEDIDYLHDSMNKKLKERNYQALNDFESIQVKLYPEGGLQERSWNILPFLNAHGFGFIQDMVNQCYEYDRPHYLIYLSR